MLKREIQYEDFDGEQKSEIFYFYISKPELIEMELEYEGGFVKFLQKIIETKDHRELIKQFKDLVLKAYGVKSEDGKRFEKSDKLREEFAQTAAYETLFMEMATNDNAAATFIKAILPKGMAEQVDQDKPILPPASPTPPTPPNS